MQPFADQRIADFLSRAPAALAQGHLIGIDQTAVQGHRLDTGPQFGVLEQFLKIFLGQIAFFHEQDAQRELGLRGLLALNAHGFGQRLLA